MFGIGPSAKIVGKSQGKRKNNASGKMAVFGPFFSVHGWPYRAKKGRPCFDMFPMFLVFFVYLLTTFRPCFQPVLFSIFIDFLTFFTTNIAQHSTQHTQYTTTHTHTHTRTPATDRDRENGLSKSNARKNPGKCLKKAKSGESLANARFDMDGQIVRLRRSGERPIEPSGSWFPPKFLSFSGKSA